MSEPPVPPIATAAKSAFGKPTRRMTARWRFANRLNARASTGPRTTGGKARVARNALRHGLNVPVPSDLGFAAEVVELARRIEQSVVGRSLDGERHELTCRVAETLIDLRRVRLAKRPLWVQVDADLEHCAKPLARLARLDRYEGRTLIRRKRAARAFLAAVMDLLIAEDSRQRQNVQSTAMPSQAKDSNEGPDDRQ